MENDSVNLSPGTIVLQYMDDNHRVVGLVVPDLCADKLHESEAKRLHDSRSDPVRWGDLHVVLVLGCQGYTNNEDSLFTQYKQKSSFPWYELAHKNSATPCDLKEELALYRLYRNEPRSRGLMYGHLRGAIFAFNRQNAETLALVSIAQALLAREDVDAAIKSLEIHHQHQAKKFLDEVKNYFM